MGGPKRVWPPLRTPPLCDSFGLFDQRSDNRPDPFDQWSNNRPALLSSRAAGDRAPPAMNARRRTPFDRRSNAF